MKINKKSGISLIVLVITIIIMIILAAAVILSLNSSNIVEKANQAKSNNDYANANELKSIAYAKWMLMSDAEQESYGSFSAYADQKLQEAGCPVPEFRYTDGADGVTGVLDEGDIVEHKESKEVFYVIKTEGDTVSLLSKYNLKADGSEQATPEANNPCAFCTTTAWDGASVAVGDNLNNKTSIRDEATSAVGKAIKYGTSLGGTGRLMTVEEIEELGASKSNNSTSGCPDWINTTNFWLGSASSTDRVWRVYGESSDLYVSFFSNDRIFGVRAVIDVSQSSIN